MSIEVVKDMMEDFGNTSQDQQKRLECFLALLMYKHKVPYSDLHNAVLEAKASTFRPAPPEMDGCVAELVFWLTQYEIGQDLPEGYKLTERPYEDEDE